MEAQVLRSKTVEAIKTPGLHGDGAGLYLQVGKTGARSWIYRYRVGAKQKTLGLGGFPAVSLAEARRKSADARMLRSKGHDPLEAKRASARLHSNGDHPMTFQEATDAYLTAFGPSLKNDKHRAQWRATLYDYAVPVFGSTPVADVNQQQVLEALKLIWWRIPETASRVRGRIESVIGFAITEGHRTSPNCAYWQLLRPALPSKTKVKSVTHHAALPHSDVPDFIKQLRQNEGLPELALEMLVLTAVRTRELLLAEHDEFNLDAAVWVIPARRMKIKSQDHRVPLAPRVVEIVRQAMEHRRGTESLLFPGRKINRPFSDMLFLMIMRRMGFGAFTAHGFRSCFKDWAAETTTYPHELSERALAHLVGNKVSRSYQRSDLLEKRRTMMLDWASFIESHFTTKAAKANQLA